MSGFLIASALCLAFGHAHAMAVLTKTPFSGSLTGSFSLSRRSVFVGVGWAAACFPTRAAQPTEEEDLGRLREGLRQLTILLENWDEATLNCKYAEVNRELLTADKKEELLDAASKSVLFNKGNATKTLCKRDAEIVRYVMGVGGEKNKKSGPPVMFAARGIYDKDKEMPQPLLNVEPVIKRGFLYLSDNQDAYLEASENWSRAKSGLSANSYASGVADMSSIISTSEGKDESSSYLETSRKFAVAAKEALGEIVQLLEFEADS